MTLAPKVQEALRRWVGPITWDSSHPLDRARFYDFVRALFESSHALPDEAAIRGAILSAVEKAHPQAAKRTEVERFVRERMSIAIEIIEYLLRVETS